MVQAGVQDRKASLKDQKQILVKVM